MPGRVLIADDNADMRAYLTRLLQARFTVEGVSDRRAALDAARAHPPDVVLSDVMMPRLDGFGLLRELKSDVKLSNVPVILLSARAGDEAKVEGIRAGASDCSGVATFEQTLESVERSGLLRDHIRKLSSALRRRGNIAKTGKQRWHRAPDRLLREATIDAEGRGDLRDHVGRQELHNK